MNKNYYINMPMWQKKKILCLQVILALTVSLFVIFVIWKQPASMVEKENNIFKYFLQVKKITTEHYIKNPTVFFLIAKDAQM